MMQITDEMIEAFGLAFFPVNAASKIEAGKEEIRVAIEAAFAAAKIGWLPVKDAPKDGMTVDLWDSVAQERVADARFINGNWKIWGQDGFENMGWVAAEHQDGFTHFMHIPVAPHSSEVAP